MHLSPGVGGICASQPWTCLWVSTWGLSGVRSRLLLVREANDPCLFPSLPPLPAALPCALSGTRWVLPLSPGSSFSRQGGSPG